MPARPTTLAAMLLLLSGNADDDFNAAGYRTAHVRSPVRRAPDGTARITVPAAAGIWRSRDAIFIDVLPAEGGAADPKTGRWRLAEPHSSIPGAFWFPGAGAGEPPIATNRWFQRGLASLTRGQKDRMVVVFCKADCWLSWNAARRLASSGYRNVWWLAEGVDGWREAGLPLAPVHPQIISEISDSR